LAVSPASLSDTACLAAIILHVWLSAPEAVESSVAVRSRCGSKPGAAAPTLGVTGGDGSGVPPAKAAGGGFGNGRKIMRAIM
jgi:hypothetical protein